MKNALTTYLILLRGVNVGGKNKVPMAALRACLEERGYRNVMTYIASGNVIVSSTKSAGEIQTEIEQLLPTTFKLDSQLVRALVLTHSQLRAVVDNKPAGFGDQPETYHSDAIFLIGVTASDAMPAFKPREGVDVVWPGEGVIYSQRVSALRTKSRLSAIAMSPLYPSMTIRSWRTTQKLLELLEAAETSILPPKSTPGSV